MCAVLLRVCVCVCVQCLQHVTRPGSLFTLCSFHNAFTDAKSPATPKMSEHPSSLHLFQMHFIFLLANTELTGGRLSIRVIMSLKHLKAFGRPDTRRCEGPEEGGRHHAPVFRGKQSPRCVCWSVYKCVCCVFTYNRKLLTVITSVQVELLAS